MPRRDFLRLSAVGLGATSTLVLPGVRAGAEPATPGRLRTAFRLSTHGRRTCHACKSHAANRFYRTFQAADTFRAHLGCNCGIVTQPLLAGIYFCFFAQSDLYDRRWKTASCPEP
jgi:hypothetical protein